MPILPTRLLWILQQQPLPPQDVSWTDQPEAVTYNYTGHVSEHQLWQQLQQAACFERRHSLPRPAPVPRQQVSVHPPFGESPCSQQKQIFRNGGWPTEVLWITWSMHWIKRFRIDTYCEHCSLSLWWEAKHTGLFLGMRRKVNLVHLLCLLVWEQASPLIGECNYTAS